MFAADVRRDRDKAAASKFIENAAAVRSGRRLNNRAENSYLTFRRTVFAI
jgi:hypothetical protein